MLLGPVERQVEFAQTRRGKFDGLAALQKQQFRRLRDRVARIRHARSCSEQRFAPGLRRETALLEGERSRYDRTERLIAA